MLYACVNLSCSRLCHAWRPERVCGCVVTFDAHKASFGCNHLRCITLLPVASCIPFPFSAPCDVMLTIHVCATRWLYMHLYALSYMYTHESCLLMCHPYFNPMKLWTPNPNLHLSLVDTTFCLLAYLFAFLLVCLLSCLFAVSLVCSHPCFYVCHIYHVYLREDNPILYQPVRPIFTVPKPSPVQKN